MYVPKAQGSTLRTLYADQPWACRTYRVPWHHRRRLHALADVYGERYRHLGATSQYLMEKIVSVEADEPELLMRRLETIEAEVLRSRPVRVCCTGLEPRPSGPHV